MCVLLPDGLDECRVGRQYLCQVSVSVCLAAWWSRGTGNAGLAASVYVSMYLCLVVQRSGERRVGRQYLYQVSVSVCLAAWWFIGVGSSELAGSTFFR